MTSKATLPLETGRLLFRQLASAVRNKASLSDVLNILAQDSESAGRSAELLKLLAANHTADTPLSQALAKVPGLFASETVALIRHAEQANRLPEILDTLASDYQRRRLSHGVIKSALMWPLTISGVLALVACIVLIFVVPAFKDVFSSFGADLPGPTVLLMNVSDLIVNVGWVVFIVAIAGVVAHRLDRLPTPVTNGYWKACMALPVVRAYFVREFSARLAGWLHALNGDREGMAAAVLHLRATARAPFLRDCASTLVERLGKEEPLSAALQNLKPLPQGLLLAARLGEASGNLHSALDLAQELADEQAVSAADRMGQWLFNCSYISIGVLTAFFVIAMYLPIFKLGSAV